VRISYLYNLGTDELMAIGAELERAIVDHIGWLKGWHRALICHVPFEHQELSADAHRLCAFGRWYYLTSHEELRQDPELAEIGRLHREMHRQARKLGLKAQAGVAIPTELYESFIDGQIEFSSRIQVLRNKVTGYRHRVDPLLNIAGRQVMYPVLLQEQERVKRTGQPCTLALLDLDKSKRMNDTHGHLVGDEVPKRVTTYLRDGLRVNDSLFRYGGEEFLMCLPNTSLEQASEMLERLRRGLGQLSVKIDGEPALNIRISGGLSALYPDVSIDKAIESVDLALCQAKREGRDRLASFS
jgi:diguanylate cyclase